jgi:uncharacterized protein (DUF924 family)
VIGAADGARDILDFWFDEVGPQHWWTRSDATDDAIRARFGRLWEAWRDRPAERFLGTADKALAAVILFDQFARNIFRGDARAFATDALALAIARGAIDRGLDGAMTEDERSFLYLPFSHAEDIAAQDEGIALFEALGRAEPLRFARLHRAVIVEHGRFPARNAALGRPTRPDEQAALDATRHW